jgi:hypothetical protein
MTAWGSDEWWEAPTGAQPFDKEPFRPIRVTGVGGGDDWRRVHAIRHEYGANASVRSLPG